MNITIHNKTITLRDCYCSKDGLPPSMIDVPYVNLYVQMMGCNAKCKFCNQTPAYKFNLDAFTKVLQILSKSVSVRKISFTGGEPCRDLTLLHKAYQIALDALPQVFRVISTNGTNLSSVLASTIGDTVNSIALSRHHFDDAKNRELMSFDAPSADVIRSVAHNNKIHLSCNLVKGYIDSWEQVHNYLEWVNQMGMDDVGFVLLMPYNEFCKENRVDLLDLSPINGMFCNMQWNRDNVCACKNYLYVPKDYQDRVIKVYCRTVKKPCAADNLLVFDGENLRHGFGGEIII